MVHTGYVIMHTICPVLWCIKLQTDINLGTTEAEYIALAQEMHKVTILWQWWMKYILFSICIFQIQKSFVNYFKTIKVVLPSRSITNNHQGGGNIAINYHYFQSFVKRILFRYAIPVNKNNHQAFSLSYPMKHYSCIYKENYLDGDLKMKPLFWHEGFLG